MHLLAARGHGWRTNGPSRLLARDRLTPSDIAGGESPGAHALVVDEYAQWRPREEWLPAESLASVES